MSRALQATIPVTRVSERQLEKIRLVLWGAVPSKKNMRSLKSKGRYYDQKTKAELKALETYARIQWGPRRAADNPRMEFHFFVKARRKDRDGMYTTILDCLVKARVLHNDSVRWCNGAHVLHPVIVAQDERVEVLIEEAD